MSGLPPHARAEVQRILDANPSKLVGRGLVSAHPVAAKAVELSRREQGLPPRITDRRALERVAALLSNARPAGSDSGRSGSTRGVRDQPRRTRARRR
jgi:hypothetical protein